MLGSPGKETRLHEMKYIAAVGYSFTIPINVLCILDFEFLFLEVKRLYYSSCSGMEVEIVIKR